MHFFNWNVNRTASQFEIGFWIAETNQLGSQKPYELKFDWPVSHFPPPPPHHAVQTSMLHCNQLKLTKTLRAQVWLACITQTAHPQKASMFLTMLGPNVGGCKIVPKNDLKCNFLIEMSIGPNRNSKSDFGSLKPTSSSPQKPYELKFDWPVSHFPPPPPTPPCSPN